VRILESFTTAAVAHNIVAGFGNAGVRFLPDEDFLMRGNVTPYTARCLPGLTFHQGPLVLLPEDEEDERPDIEEYIVRLSGPLSHRGKPRAMAVEMVMFGE
jgi:hypothetical protein